MDMTTCILCEINYFLCGFQVNMTLCFNCVFKCWSVWFEFSALPFSDCVVLARELTTVETAFSLTRARQAKCLVC